MTQLFSNNAVSTLASGITGSATTVVIQAGDANAFPTPSGASDFFLMTLEDKNTNPVSREIVKCTARSSSSITVVRGQEGTTPLSFNAGATAAVRVTAATLVSFQTSAGVVTTLYLGAFSTAPSSGVGGAALVPGNLYFNSTSRQLFNYDGAFWLQVNPTVRSLAFGVYLGQFSVPPILMPDGTALITGTIYYDTGLASLQEWNGTAWVNASTQTTINNPTNPNTANVGNSTFQNITVLDTTNTKNLVLNGQPVLTAANLQGDALSQMFPDGTRIQWGTVGIVNDGSAHTTTIAFPRAFTVTPFVALASTESLDPAQPKYIACTVVAVSSTQMLVSCVDISKLIPSASASILASAATAVLVVAGSYAAGSVGATVGAAIGNALQPQPVGHGTDPITAGILHWIAIGPGI